MRRGVSSQTSNPALPLARPILRPILDTHIHVFQVSRPGGVPWPPPHAELYRDILPAAYEAAARPLGIIGSGVVEASNLHADTRWVLDQIAGNDFFPFVVAQLEIGAPDFEAKLDEITQDARVVGIRGFLWSPTLTISATQVAQLRLLGKRGMTLDLISRGDLNPKDKIDKLAAAVPNLRMIIDHLGGAKGAVPDSHWMDDMRMLARRPNVFIKLSSLYDMFNPAADDNHPWTAPQELSAYRAHFDVIFESFGPQRILFGSNWPVCTLAGSLADEIRIVEEYLDKLGPKVRDAVMHENARSFYRRV
jgi:L-fuconolactonase